jgi:hypothetical protein
MPRLVKDKIMAEDNYAKNARQDALLKKENEDYKKHLEREKEENEAPRKALSEAFDSVVGVVKKAPEEIMRGVRRVGQNLGIAEDPNKYTKTPQGERMANSDAAKGARNYVRLYKEGLGMRDKNDDYEKKSGGKISLKDCKVNTAEKRNSKHKSW